MKRVILRLPETDYALLSNIKTRKCIFAVKDGEIQGMIINESEGFILRFPPGTGCSGHFPTREACIISAGALGFEFYTE